jgi:hypothetical protein
VGSGEVSGRSQAGVKRVPSRCRAVPGQVPGGSWVGLGMVHRFLNEMLNIKKWFTIFKTVNHFPKIKEEFLVKGKLFSVDYYFTSHQIHENT